MATTKDSKSLVLSRIDYLLNLCDEILHAPVSILLTLSQIPPEMQLFLASYTKQNIFDVILKANVVKHKAQMVNQWEYKCIKFNMFMLPRLQQDPVFDAEIKPIILTSTGRSPTRCTILDIGCCFGTDLRYCLHLGCDKKQIFGVDVSSDFVDLGFEFYGDRSELQDRFIAANVLENEGLTFIDKALKANQGKQFDIVYVGGVYHLLTEQQCLLLTRIISSLIAEKDGILYGSALGALIAGIYPRFKTEPLRYLHSPQSFRDTLIKYGKFREVEVKTNEAVVKRMSRVRESLSGITDKKQLTFFNFVCRV